MSDYPRPAMAPQERPTYACDLWFARIYAVLFLGQGIYFVGNYARRSNFVWSRFEIYLAVELLGLALWLWILGAISNSRRWPFFVGIILSAIGIASGLRFGNWYTVVTHLPFVIYCVGRLIGVLGPRPRSRV